MIDVSYRYCIVQIKHASALEMVRGIQGANKLPLVPAS